MLRLDLFPVPLCRFLSEIPPWLRELCKPKTKSLTLQDRCNCNALFSPPGTSLAQNGCQIKPPHVWNCSHTSSLQPGDFAPGWTSSSLSLKVFFFSFGRHWAAAQLILFNHSRSATFDSRNDLLFFIHRTLLLFLAARTSSFFFGVPNRLLRSSINVFSHFWN